MRLPVAFVVGDALEKATRADGFGVEVDEEGLGEGHCGLQLAVFDCIAASCVRMGALSRQRLAVDREALAWVRDGEVSVLCTRRGGNGS